MNSRLVALALLVSSCGIGQSLEQGFRTPPDSAKPHTWWHWMNGMVTREGITRDLEEMRKVGLGGAQMFHVTDGIPAGPVGYMTPQWREMVKHAVTEADRLGLELCIHNCAGWSSSGGPWIDPAHSMQMLTSSEVRVVGPVQAAGKLPMPPSRQDYYEDIAVLAFPTPVDEVVNLRESKPQVTLNGETTDAEKVVDGDPGTSVRLRKPSKRRPQLVTFAFGHPFRAQAITIVPGPGRNSHGGEIQVSADGKEFRTLRSFRLPSTGITQTLLSVRFEPTVARFWQVVFDSPDQKAGSLGLAEIELHGASRIEDWPSKAGYLRGSGAPEPAVPAESCIVRTGVQDVTAHLAADGTLDWAVPKGHWTIVRIGHTTTGKENHPAPDEGRGLECDKLSREAAQIHWDGMMAKVLDDIGPLAGKVLNNVLVDSYEVGCQNWTPKFREEFKRRRGYDLLPYLPAMLGWVIDDADTSDRFLWDVRTTLAELFHENYFGFFRDMAHKHGMLFSVEGYGNGNFDNLVASGMADIPMSEFWAGRGVSNHGSSMASSAAHIWGRKYVGAESFTANPEAAGWRQHPQSLKALGDFIYCGGVNRFIFHRYAQQPWLDRVPGMTMGPHGFHFDWTNTWWEQAPAWTTYLSRCQYLLQSGRFVADFCYYVGEGSPQNSLFESGLRPAMPDGFAQDNCATDALLQLFSVRDGQLVVPSGMSYRLLVLPPRQTMTPTVLRKVKELLEAGATIVGPRPLRSPSLADNGAGDGEVQRLGAEIWGNCDGEKVTSRQVGKGTLYWNHPMDQILAECDLVPDATFTSETKPRISWIHRRIEGADAYFLSNQAKKSQAVDCRFRIADRIPELWHPDTGKMEVAPIYRRDGQHTVVSLLMQPEESVFVVFRAQNTANPVVSATFNGTPLLRPVADAAPKLEIRHAVYGVLAVSGIEGVMDVTTIVRNMVRDDRLTVTASNSLAGDPASGIVKRMVVQYELGGKPGRAVVGENQSLSLPPEGQGGKLVILRAAYGDLPTSGVLPTLPDQTVDVTEALRKEIHNGRLTIKASNDLAGDPASNIRKQMRIEYAVDGAPMELVVDENTMIDLPTGEPPAWLPCDLTQTRDAVRLTGWQEGEVGLTYADGATRTVSLPAPPAALAIVGPWRLSFQPNRAAPAQVTLPELISWPDHELEGVKHFSGTATYEIAFAVSAEQLKAGTEAMLDLGNVQVIAEPTLNGKPLGTLWKPPFRVDVTSALKPGKNVLRVAVTNLWVNRLIGDEEKPDYREWSGPHLKSWPEDALKSTPPPDTGRVTWTTWKHYNAGDPLVPSGLIGPVRIRFASVQTVTR